MARLSQNFDGIDKKYKVFILGHKDNIGYAKGNNLGANFLLRHFDIDYFLFTNNDLRIVDVDVVEKLIETCEAKEEIGAIGSKMVRLDGRDQNPGRYLSIWRRYIIPWIFCPVVYP